MSNADIIHEILSNIDNLDLKVLYKIYYTLKPRLYLPKHYEEGIVITYKYIKGTGDDKKGRIRVYPETPCMQL